MSARCRSPACFFGAEEPGDHYRTESRKARARVAHAFRISKPTTFEAIQLYIYSKIIQFFVVALREA